MKLLWHFGLRVIPQSTALQKAPACSEAAAFPDHMCPRPKFSAVFQKYERANITCISTAAIRPTEQHDLFGLQLLLEAEEQQEASISQSCDTIRAQ